MSDSLSQLGERIAEMTVEEETATAGTGAGNEGTGARNGNCLKAFEPVSGEMGGDIYLIVILVFRAFAALETYLPTQYSSEIF